MNCHLIKKSKAGELAADNLKRETTRIESILESDSFDVRIVKCRDCGQTFAYCFKQYAAPDGEDDYWTFWIPIAEQEIDTLRTANPLLKFMGEMVNEHAHICWHPDGHLFWSEKGFPLALVVFLP